ncbi:hypothetical protein GPECTOR_23g91 [Gonium pectorale]|uniref:Uncharacterized protein n=1 Tax=Gonium pectorale TaxID=33097 RepID=A0A150GHR2_GONPE|nr:hypothetical protein GPECTOR_23g91 [Gonium pectorale]|eukprot:KXZ49165.1 hypothetical protein GPECTOR_23g91 [Gonium pectorale]
MLLHVSASASALASPPGGVHIATELLSLPTSSQPVMQQLLLSKSYTDIHALFSAHRTALTPADLAAMFVRLAKISKDPAVRGSPELQKFVDIMACAAIERMQQLTPANLCSVVWAASKLKKDLPQSGMFKSFLKAWAAEMEPHVEDLELEQLRKCLAALTRVAFSPGPNWHMKVEAALTARMAAAAEEGAPAVPGAPGGGGGVCPKTLACCLVSAASLGLGAHPSAAFKQAVAAACGAAFAGGPATPAPQTAAAGGGGRDAGRSVCSSLWACAVLGVSLEEGTVRAMVSLVTGMAPAPPSSSSPDGEEGPERTVAVDPALTPLDYAQVFWALSRLRYRPSESELTGLLGGTTRVLPAAQPELLATILWALADLEVVPPQPWLQAVYDSFEARLERAAAEPLQALLHAAASLQLPAPAWRGRLMERLQDVDLRPLPDGNMVDLVTSMHALAMHPPPQLAHRLQDECIKRLAARNSAAAAAGAAAGAAASGNA